MESLMETLTSEELLAVGALVGGIATAAAVLTAIWFLFRLIAGWRVFSKMGEPGWKSLIPIYHDYILYGKVWKASMCWAYLIPYCVGSYLNETFEESILLQLVALVLIIAAFVVQIKCFVRLSRSFGHGKLFAAGLFLLEPVFTLILAFGSDKYLGNLSDHT